MKKYLLALLSVALLIFYPAAALAEVTQDQITQRYETIEDLKKQIASLDTTINELQSEINQLTTSIEKTSQDLVQAQQQEADLKAASEERLRIAYMYGTDGFMDYIFSAESPSEFVSYYDIAVSIIKADQKSASELKQKREEIQKLKDQLTDQRSRQVIAKKQSETAKSQKQTTLQENQTLVARLESELTEQQQAQERARKSPTVTVTPEQQSKVVAQASTPSVINSTPAQGQTTAPTADSEQPTDGEVQTATAAAVDDSEEYADGESVSSESGEEADSEEYQVDGSEPEQEGEPSSAMTLPRYVSEVAGNNGANGYFNGSYMTQIPDGKGGVISVPYGELSNSWYWPLDANGGNAFLITSLMGSRESPGGIGSTDHGGTDIGADYGTAIIAASSGVVEIAGTYGGYGNAVMINHGNGYKTLYGHMSEIAEGIREGQKVEGGQIIGFVGSTGWSTGPHLHFEVRYTDESGGETKINGLSLYGQDIYDRLTYALDS